MGANQSNLAKCGYDMVTATTQASVNATMKQWLDGYQGTVYIQAYAYDRDGDAASIKPIDFNKLKTELGFDPFSVASGKSDKDAKIAKIMEKRLACAFAIKMGFPAQAIPADLPAMITFTRAEREVGFNLISNTFKCLNLQKNGSIGTWTNVKQDEDDIYYFGMKGRLSTRKEPLDKRFHELPNETKTFINREGKSYFRITELVMTLDANATTANPATMVPAGHATNYLVPFIKSYVEHLKSDIVLGYSVVARKDMSTSRSIVPTAIDFIVSPYRDAAGNPTDDYKAYTLNYLVMADNPTVPSAPIMWNWVDKDKVSQYAGVAAVNRNLFIKYLQDVFSMRLHEITQQPSVSYTTHCDSVSWVHQYFTDTAHKNYNVVTNGGSHVLTYSWYRNNLSSDTSYCVVYAIWGNMESRYYAQSDVYIEGNTIRLETVLTGWVHINVVGGVVEGNFAKSKSVSKYDIGVDSFGRITVSMEPPVITDLSDKIEVGGWIKFVTQGEINKAVERIKNRLKELMDRYLASYADSIKSTLNSCDGWVFPGGKTFAFKEAGFSANQDLVAHILFLSPKQMNILRSEGMPAVLKMIKEEEEVAKEMQELQA
jgi:hypothetical protein